ncbi:MAG: COX15/CtaA family protein [Opitutales bacterium]
MSASLKQRTTGYQRNLASFSFLVFAASLVVIYAGGFTTTIGAGMVFLDWPLSNGSLNPPGWVTDQDMLAEHSHRLMGATTGLLAIVLAVWMYLRQGRTWLRWLSYGALAFIVFQGLLGGARVLLVSVDLAQIHGITAQLFLCTLVALSVGTSAWWQRLPTEVVPAHAPAWSRQRTLGLVLIALLVVQLVLGATLRHRGAGLAIPYFPASAADGSLLPPAWNWAVTIHFAHRAVALGLSVLLVAWAWLVWRSPFAIPAMRRLAVTSVVLLVVQVLLGASVIWTLRQPLETTLHVLNGALLLSAVSALTFAYFRPILEGSARTVAAPAAAEPIASGSLTPQRG